MNGELRDIEKVLRGLTKDSPILTDYQLFHSYIQTTHSTVDGRTAAEIKINGKDKWLTIIQNAKRVR